ncbi:MAG: hypothetical protein HKO53_02815 [Gemmatimonadetes bacterium]|nr:hypothetical protein [Gemmatimonadota bacterium]
MDREEYADKLALSGEPEKAMAVMKERKWTVAVDFDGVLHSYTTPWLNAHTIPDPPVPGAIEWLHSTVQTFNVAIYSTRSKTWRGRRAMKAWLKKHAGNIYWEAPGFLGLEDVTFSAEKPPALVYVDDRAYRFTGDNFPTQDEIHNLRPWNKGRKDRQNGKP